MIKPLTLGSKTFPVNLIQGPLAGVSCAPFRLLTCKFSQPAFSCTEMISCKTIIHQPKLSIERYINKDPAEGPVCFQLSASNEMELAEATRRVTDYGADLIDLNCGCPVKKIRSKGAGSSLLSDPIKLYKLIRAMKDNTHLPVSIKIRVSGDHISSFNTNERNPDRSMNRDIANVVTDAGADFLIVHGRHWTERYDTACRYDEIRFFVDQLKIPVIGNGDIACVDSLKKMLATGCAGVMISRSGVGQPWLIGKLIAEMNQNEFTLPSQKEIGHIFMQHVQQLAMLLGNEKFAVLQARKLAKYYARSLPHKMEFCEAINHSVTLNELNAICEVFFIN